MTIAPDSAGLAFGQFDAIGVQADGKVVLAGSEQKNPSTPDYDFEVIRLNADGSLDTLFGSAGRVRIPFDLGGPGQYQTGDEDVPQALTIAPDAKIVVVGQAEEALGGGAPSSTSRRPGSTPTGHWTARSTTAA